MYRATALIVLPRHNLKEAAAVSCSADGAMLGGVKMGLGSTGKLGRAWHGCMGGAWRVCMASMLVGVWGKHNDVDGGVVGLVRLDLSIGVWFWLRYVVTSLMVGCPIKWKFLFVYFCCL